MVRLSFKTGHGIYKLDSGRIWHYAVSNGCTVDVAAADAIKHCPRDSAAWFWCGGPPTEMLDKDDVPQLIQRWEKWKEVWAHGNGPSLSIDDFLGL